MIVKYECNGKIYSMDRPTYIYLSLTHFEYESKPLRPRSEKEKRIVILGSVSIHELLQEHRYLA